MTNVIIGHSCRREDEPDKTERVVVPDGLTLYFHAREDENSPGIKIPWLLQECAKGEYQEMIAGSGQRDVTTWNYNIKPFGHDIDIAAAEKAKPSSLKTVYLQAPQRLCDGDATTCGRGGHDCTGLLAGAQGELHLIICRGIWELGHNNERTKHLASEDPATPKTYDEVTQALAAFRGRGFARNSKQDPLGFLAKWQKLPSAYQSAFYFSSEEIMDWFMLAHMRKYYEEVGGQEDERSLALGSYIVTDENRHKLQNLAAGDPILSPAWKYAQDIVNSVEVNHDWSFFSRASLQVMNSLSRLCPIEYQRYLGYVGLVADAETLKSHNRIALEGLAIGDSINFLHSPRGNFVILAATTTYFDGARFWFAAPWIVNYPAKAARAAEDASIGRSFGDDVANAFEATCYGPDWIPPLDIVPL